MALVAWLVSAPARAEKTDVIILDNGDHITGEIKGMSRGKLDYKTDDAGRLSVEWTKVAQVTSIHAFEVELSSGKKIYGTLGAGAEKGEVAVGGEGGETVPVPDVVAITPMDDRFWSRVKAYLDLGFSLAKANSVVTLSGDGEFAYRGEHFGGSLDFDLYFQNDSSGSLVSRASVNLTGNYFFAYRWRLLGQLGFDHNDELDLRVRSSLGAATAYSAVRNSFMELWVAGGLVGDHEVYTSESNYNLAALVAADWEAFRYDTPKLDAGVQVQILPVLTDLGRFRGTASVRVKYEIFKDFNVGLSFSYTFDTRPPDPTAGNTDYLLSLTVGWSYRR